MGVEDVYRRYDNGTAGYTAGYQPGASNYPLSQIYTGPLTYTDPVTGKSATYWEVCATCRRPAASVGTVTITSQNYSVYQGVITTINKRFSDRWMVNGSLTMQTNPQYIDHQVNPTGQEYVDGYSTIARYLLKLNGSYAAPWGINVAANLNYNDGPTRSLRIRGPQNAAGGLNANNQPTRLSGNNQPYQTLRFEPEGTTRLDPTALLDLGIHKVISFRGGRNRVKVMADLFNVFNIATIRGYESNNMSTVDFLAPSSIVPPRVFRIGAQIAF